MSMRKYSLPPSPLGRKSSVPPPKEEKPTESENSNPAKACPNSTGASRKRKAKLLLLVFLLTRKTQRENPRKQLMTMECSCSQQLPPGKTKAPEISLINNLIIPGPLDFF
ncbi:hypothetical protein D0Y65_014474 [Glycine soja]|uniref:Uncharacterized protein n=1 Tax=Glycine soja TaxID=3848 RepID=A0A445K8H4_GLYSO|nr:hypothetical protein D0Y65_014474 [Glycine soja]